ncbi:hypothetical protein LINPERPRIM_LOCUS15014 [Linum perenne]
MGNVNGREEVGKEELVGERRKMYGMAAYWVALPPSILLTSIDEEVGTAVGSWLFPMAAAAASTGLHIKS